MNSRRAVSPLLAAALIVSVSAHAATYRIDPKDTTASYEVRYLGLFTSRGEFRRTTGTLVYDVASKQGSIDVSIDTTTLEASTAGARASARGPDFFDVEKYPSIDFKSSRFIFDENRLRSVEGNLTLIGKTQPVVQIVNDSKCVAAVEQEPGRCHAAAELRVKRSAFGMKAWSHTVGEEVTIRIGLSAVQAAGKEPPKDAPKDTQKEPVKEPPKSEPAPEAPPGR
jgi:polyisoprenoid-binding protein YceI